MAPRRFRVRRFLVWSLLLVVGAYLVWGRIEAWRLSRAVAAIQARGEPVDYSYWHARQVTAEQREAAALYARAADFAAEAESGQQYRASQLDVDKPGGPGLSLDDIAASYRRDSSAMQLLDRATPMDFTEFGEANRELYDNQIPLQVLGAQACLRADLIAAGGDGDGAAAALAACLRLQRTLLPTYRSQHSGRLLGSFRILLRHASPSDASLTALQRAFVVWPEGDGVVRALLQDRVRFLSYADARPRGIGEFLMTALMRPFLTSVARRRLTSYDEALMLARLPPKARREAATRRAPVPTRRGFFAALFASPQIYAGFAYNTETLDLAARRTMLSALAVERYRRAHLGAVPPSLDALVPAWLPWVPEDPYSAGQPIVYRVEPDSYVVYSVDSNRKDDGGELYGHGSAIAKHVGPQSPRDLGIRVPLTPKR
jgi:hypothetical protein